MTSNAELCSIRLSEFDVIMRKGLKGEHVNFNNFSSLEKHETLLNQTRWIRSVSVLFAQISKETQNI